MPKVITLAPSFKEYSNTEAVGRFMVCAIQELQPLALILFGSLARGDYHQFSDADVCLVLAEAPPTPFAGYDQATACDPSGVVQPVVYGADHFRPILPVFPTRILADSPTRKPAT